MPKWGFYTVYWLRMSDTQKSRRIKLAVNVVTILALVVLAYAVREQLAETFENLHHVNLWVLVCLIPLQILNFFSQANLYQSMLRMLKERFRLKPMIRLVTELNFVNTVFPSGGVSGFSYLSLRLKKEGISTGKSTFVQMMRFVLIFVSVQIWLFFGLIALAIGGQAHDVALLIAGVLGTLIAVLMFLLAYIIGSKKRINAFFTFIAKQINSLIHIVRPKHPETINIDRAKQAFTEMHETFLTIRKDWKELRRPLGFAMFSVLCEVLTIYTVYVAFGRTVNIGAVVMAYAVANFAGLVSILPGGIGIYEALMTAVLTAGGIPAAISLPVTVMYRVLNTGIQLPIGYFFYHKTLHAEPSLAVAGQVDEQ